MNEPTKPVSPASDPSNPESVGKSGVIPPEIRFYRAVGRWGFLSNLYRMPVGFWLPEELTPDGERFRDPKFFKTSEEAYQYGKPKNQEIANWITEAPKPHLCAAAAHSLFVFDIRTDWATVKIDRMRMVLRRKFDVHQQYELWRALMETGHSVLVEESNADAFWGIGKKGTGKNMLGVLLMELRAELRAALPICGTNPKNETREGLSGEKL